MTKEYNTVDEILIMADSSINIPFSMLDKTNRLYSVKGGIGQMIEESVFGMNANSESAPDFAKLGIELKVTPFLMNESGKRRSKERLVLNIINYMSENLDSFYDSHFWFKNKSIFIMFYEHKKDVERDMWYIDNFILFEWPTEDLHIIKNDWKIITNKIKNGIAHEISEADTMYLSACTKGATAASSYRDQPFSSIKAKQRAYSLKTSYMTYILNNYVYGNATSEKIIKYENILKDKSFEDVIIEMFEPFIGKTQKELVEQFNVTESKATNASIINRILKLNGNVSKTEEFQKANIIAKTIRIEKNGSIKESMSFATFKFKELIMQSWETSDFYDFISQTRFMFVVFKKTDDTESNAILSYIKFWGMPDADIEEAKICWENTVNVIKSGVNLLKTNNGISNNLPKSTENRVAHVRPHASKSYYKFDGYESGNQKDGNELPDGRWMTTQCFWLNRKYVSSIIKK